MNCTCTKDDGLHVAQACPRKKIITGANLRNEVNKTHEGKSFKSPNQKLKFRRDKQQANFEMLVARVTLSRSEFHAEPQLQGAVAPELTACKSCNVQGTANAEGRVVFTAGHLEGRLAGHH